jgi:hypothetical protein
VNHREDTASSSGTAILLDAGIVFDVWVAKAF